MVLQAIMGTEKWARIHNIPFPPIAELCQPYMDQPPQEVYVFKDPNHKPSEVPVVILFVLVNKDFKEFSSPGRRRTTDAEKQFANFSLFENSADYSPTKVLYTQLQVDRLVALVEFNIKNNIDIIKREIKAIVDQRNT